MDGELSDSLFARSGSRSKTPFDRNESGQLQTPQIHLVDKLAYDTVCSYPHRDVHISFSPIHCDADRCITHLLVKIVVIYDVCDAVAVPCEGVENSGHRDA